MVWSFCSPREALELRHEERATTKARFVVSTQIPENSDEDFRFICFSIDSLSVEQLRSEGFFTGNDVFDTELCQEVK